jgi:hypothetical protein
MALALGIAALGFTTTSSAWAQAWLSPAGHGSIGITYTYTDVHKHLFSQAKDNVRIGNGLRGRSSARDLGHLSADTGTLNMDYSITSRFAISGSVAYIGSKYQGCCPDGDVDADWNRGFQDLGVNIRYRALFYPIALTPFAGFSTPTHNYSTMGHTSIGSGLRSYSLGLNVGRPLAPILPGGYVQVGYTYDFVQNIADFGLNHHSFDAQLGYFVSNALSLQVQSVSLWTPNGFDWTDEHAFEIHEEAHDRAAKVRFWRLGGAVGYSVNRSHDLFLAYMTTVTGANTHDASSTIFGTSWNF